MLDNKGFDLWADNYDKSVGLSDEEQTYPFAGYRSVLAKIYRTVMTANKASVLDIGFGTGVLASKLYENGCEIWGQDFSPKMIEAASIKMPRAHLYEGDFLQGLVEPLLQNTYDFIIATYSLHHLTDAEKISFIRSLVRLLKPNGAILIGDVAFENRRALECCREHAGDEWDDEEFYFVFDELQKFFPTMQFEKMSHCAGVLSLPRNSK